MKPLLAVQRRIARHLDEIAQLFNRPMKLTIVIRDPSDPECEVFLTDDAFEEIRAALARAEAREPMADAP